MTDYIREHFKGSNLSSIFFIWVVSAFLAWLAGRICLWPLIEFLLIGLRPNRTNDLVLNEINDTMFESRVALVGTLCLIALLLLMKSKTDKYMSQPTKMEAIASVTVCIMASGYLAYYWLYQSAYWWHLSSLNISNIYSGLLISYNIMKFIGMLCVFLFDPAKILAAKLMSHQSANQHLGLGILGLRLFILGLMCLLYFWSSIPNENLGLPATLMFGVVAISVSLYYFGNSFRSNT